MKLRHMLALLLTLALALSFGCVPNNQIVAPPDATLAPLPTVAAVPSLAPVATPTPAPTLVPTPTPSPTPAFADRDLLTIIGHETLAGLPLPDAQQMMSTVEWLSSTPRPLGSQHEQQVAQTITSAMSTMGYTVKQLPFTQDDHQRPAWRSEITIGGQTLPLEYVERTNDCNVTGAMLYWDDQQPVIRDLTGLIVVVPRFVTGAMLYNAADYGKKPICVITLEPYDQLVPFEPGATVLHAGEEAAEAVLQAAQQGAYAQIVVEGALTQYTSMNIECSNPAATGDTYILCAHYDSFHGAPGAVDNASGVSVLLEVARIFAKSNSAADVRFVFFSAEEDGLIGSQLYVASLSEEQRAAIKGVINLDMFGSPLTPMYIGSVGGKSNGITNDFLKTYEAYASEGSGTVDISAFLPTLRRIESVKNSDHASFAAVGIPAMTISQAAVPEFNHTPDDTLDKVSDQNLVRGALWALTFVLNLQ